MMKFDPEVFANPKAYSALRLYWLAEMIKRAFESELDLRRFARTHGYEMTWISEGPSQVAVLSRPEAVLAIFPGSKTPGDWFDNFRVVRRRWDVLPRRNGDLGVPKVSRGFHKHFSRTWPRLERAIATAVLERGKDRPIYFGGHSLGGVHAGLASVAWHLRWKCLPEIRASDLANSLHVYLIEPPRAGNRAFAEWYDSTFRNAWRIMHAHNGVMDPVVDLPPAALGYWQKGQPRIYAGDRCLTKREDFDRMLEQGKLSAMARWRVFSRLWQGRLAHKLTELQETLIEGGHV